LDLCWHAIKAGALAEVQKLHFGVRLLHFAALANQHLHFAAKGAS